MSAQLLRMLPIFICCFLSDRPKWILNEKKRHKRTIVRIQFLEVSNQKLRRGPFNNFVVFTQAYIYFVNHDIVSPGGCGETNF